MSKPSAPSIPAPPSYQPVPQVRPNVRFLSSIGTALSTGQFLPSVGSFLPTGKKGKPRKDLDIVDLSFLHPLVELNPDVTKQAVGLASRNVEEQQKLAYRDIINELAANNQLESSVTGNRLADLQQSYGRDIADINTRFYLADVERSLGNTMDLFKTGLGTTGNATSLGLEAEQLQNNFALQNYQNQLTASLASQPQGGSGGFFGALTGAIGGGLSGFALGGPVGAGIGAIGGGLAGGFGPSGTGGGLLSTGAGAFGMRQTNRVGSVPSYFPGSVASNDVFGKYLGSGLGGGSILTQPISSVYPY